jgi:hypothetical protein
LLLRCSPACKRNHRGDALREYNNKRSCQQNQTSRACLGRCGVVPASNSKFFAGLTPSTSHDSTLHFLRLTPSSFINSAPSYLPYPYIMQVFAITADIIERSCQQSLLPTDIDGINSKLLALGHQSLLPVLAPTAWPWLKSCMALIEVVHGLN